MWLIKENIWNFKIIIWNLIINFNIQDIIKLNDIFNKIIIKAKFNI